MQVKVLDWQKYDHALPLEDADMSACYGFQKFASEKIEAKNLYLPKDFDKHPYMDLKPTNGVMLKLRSRLTIILHIRDFEPPRELGFIHHVMSSVPLGTPWDTERMMNRDMGQFADKKREGLIMTVQYFTEAGTSDEGLLKQANEAGGKMTVHFDFTKRVRTVGATGSI